MLLTGEHFLGTSRVTFDGQVSWFKVLDDTHLLARVPLDCKPGAVAVTTTAGTARSEPFLAAWK